MKRLTPLLPTLLLIPILILGYRNSAAQDSPDRGLWTSSFSYQGRLTDNDALIDDQCDLQFSLWKDEVGGSQVGITQAIDDVAVADGLFSVQLNDADQFSATPFNGDPRWLEIAVRCPAGSGAFTTLSPRQALTGTPYAQFSAYSTWSGLAGIPAGFADNTDNDTTYSAGNGISIVADSIQAVGSPVANVLVVSPAGGDFTTINAALSSISDNGPDNRYQILVGPGEYPEVIQMKAYVDLVGAGPSLTRLVHPGGSGLHVVKTADQVVLRDLSIVNDGSGSSNFALGIDSNGVEAQIENVTVTAFGGTFNYSVYVQNGANVTLRNVRSSAVDGSSAIGMYVINASATAYESSFSGVDDTNGNGIYMSGGATPYSVKLVDSIIVGSSKILRVWSSYTVTAANSELGGGGVIEPNGGTVQCVASRDDSGAALDGSCAVVRAAEPAQPALIAQCGDQDAVVNRASTHEAVAGVIVEAGAETGRCQIQFPVALDNYVWAASSADDAEARLVGCRQSGPQTLSCLVTNVAGEGVNGPISVLLR
ncbi:MAG: hypothetical protein H6651_11950 [Ardenticatenales bacterium]|nr:hypothetical protein [Ardenticatenales bacterium]